MVSCTSRPEAYKQHEGSITREIQGLASTVPGVREVKVHLLPITPFDM